MNKFLLILISLLTFSNLLGQGVTTSSINGKVIDAIGNVLFGANITATHVPTSTFYGVSTDDEGFYRIANTRVGGPYTLTASFVGYENIELNVIYLRLGETFKADVTMGEAGFALGEILVTATAGTVGQSSGASTQISAEDIENIPTLNETSMII